MKRRKFLIGAVATLGLATPAVASGNSRLYKFFAGTLYPPRSEYIEFPKYKTLLQLLWYPNRINAQMTTPDGMKYAMGALLNVKPFDNATRRKMLIRSAERTLEQKYAA